MKSKHLIILSLISIGLVSCNGFIIEQNIVGNYYLTAPDIPEQCSISYHDKNSGSNYSTIINSTVFSIGHNKQYIIAKQHPEIGGSDKPNKNIIKYYILPVKDKLTVESKDMIIGPLNKIQFEKELIILGIKDIVFDVQIEGLK